MWGADSYEYKLEFIQLKKSKMFTALCRHKAFCTFLSRRPGNISILYVTLFQTCEVELVENSMLKEIYYMHGDANVPNTIFWIKLP